MSGSHEAFRERHSVAAGRWTWSQFHESHTFYLTFLFTGGHAVERGLQKYIRTGNFMCKNSIGCECTKLSNIQRKKSQITFNQNLKITKHGITALLTPLRDLQCEAGIFVYPQTGQFLAKIIWTDLWLAVAAGPRWESHIQNRSRASDSPGPHAGNGFVCVRFGAWCQICTCNLAKQLNHFDC